MSGENWRKTKIKDMENLLNELLQNRLHGHVIVAFDPDTTTKEDTIEAGVPFINYVCNQHKGCCDCGFKQILIVMSRLIKHKPIQENEYYNTIKACWIYCHDYLSDFY